MSQRPGFTSTKTTDKITVLRVRFEVFTAVTMKNAVFWDVITCGSCKNWRFGGKYRLHHHGDENQRARNNISSNWQLQHAAKKRRLLQEPLGVTCQKTAFFMHILTLLLMGLWSVQKLQTSNSCRIRFRPCPLIHCFLHSTIGARVPIWEHICAPECRGITAACPVNV
jgi:hypothetical protein